MSVARTGVSSISLMLARKYDLKPIALYDAMVEARNSKESTCGSLSIEFRKAGKNTFCYMFSRNNRAVAQAAISEYSLGKLRQVPPELARLLNGGHGGPVATDGSKLEKHIVDLQVGLRHVSLRARVIDKTEVRTVQSRDGLPLVVCSATLSDGTGQIRLSLWNRHIDSVTKNDIVVIHEATVGHFRGEMQLSIPKKTGSISIVRSTDGIAP